MIIRKPYAFLIKNFKKIHIALLVLSIYIYYKVIVTNSFVQEFVRLGSYDSYNNPIKSYVSIPLLIAIFISIVLTVALIFLLKHKEKPWKLYLVPALEYGLLFFILIWCRNFFASYDGTATGMDIRLIRDIIFFTVIGQFPILIIYSMRILGVDLNKFNFKLDEEYLEMDKKDREELEINFNIDYHMFIRFFNKSKRYLKYFYLEHKKLCNISFIIIGIIILYNIGIYIFVTNKSYKEGENYNINGYTIKINDSYYTDKDYKGDEIEKNRAFVIVDLSITNNAQPRKIDLNKYHIISGIDNYKQVSSAYSSYFVDLGKAIDSTKETKRNETLNTLLIFKVDKKKNKNNYVLYYQEVNGTNETNLRKIKLDIEDLSKIEEAKTIEFGENMKIKNKTTDEEISFDNAVVTNMVIQNYNSCSFDECENIEEKIYSKNDYKILKIEFSSKEFNGNDMFDFLTKYGTIKYDEDKDKQGEIKIVSITNKKYMGKEIYLKVPENFQKYENVYFEYNIRNKKYKYKIDNLEVEKHEYEEE